MFPLNLISKRIFYNINREFHKKFVMDFGFPQLTIQLIMHYITSSFLSNLWNENNMSAFKPSYSLCQGDPLSPHLLLVCMDKLSIIIIEVVRIGS